MSDTSTLIAIKYKGQMIEIPEGLTQNDISTFITSNDVSNKLEANDVSQFLTANDVSTDQPFHFFTNTTDSTKKGIVVKNGDGYAATIGLNAVILTPTCNARGISAVACGQQVDSSGNYSFATGSTTKAYGNLSAAFGVRSQANGQCSFAGGLISKANSNNSFAFGNSNTANGTASAALGGYGLIANNSNEAAIGGLWNKSDSSTQADVATLFSIGNGGNNTVRHNAFEVKLNGDIYIPDTDNPDTTSYTTKPMRRLQDLFILETSVSQLWDSSMSGGGGGSADLTNYYTKTQIDTSIANNYANKNDVSVFAKISYISQSDYDNLQVKDSSTLYIIPS